jgi:trans-aconitate 2-methyltransferase
VSTWDPNQYLKFADHRLRPALDLLARVPLEAPATVYDLGCGPGNVTRLLIKRWPGARVTGVDSSAAMLEKARAIPGITWQAADLASWAPPAPADLVYSNAALHWIDDHASLFPRLLAQVKPGGVLAVQMPHQAANPSHQSLFAIARDPAWSAKLEGAVFSNPVLEPAQYYDLLAPQAAALDLWETEYQHVLEGENPVLQWFMGSLLTPVLEKLKGDDRDSFIRLYGDKVAAAYPRRADGRTLLTMRRIFIVATRRQGADSQIPGAALPG